MDFYDPKFVPAPNGFYNTGAICYWNALIQSLISLPTFNRVLLDNEHALKNNDTAVCLINYIKEALETSTNDVGLNTNKFSKISTNILSSLLQQLRKGRKHVDLKFGQRQESASEGFVILIEMLKSLDIERVFNNRYEVASWCATCEKPIMVSTDRSLQINMFYKEKPTTASEFGKLIVRHSNSHEGYKCDDCGDVMERGVRVHKLKMLREVVLLEFNKYTVKDLRWFPEYMQFPSTNGKSLTYKLISIIEHSGGLSGGHYWCRAYRPTSATEGKFFTFNDMSVTESNAEPTEASYMLFYHVIEMPDDFVVE